MIKRISVFLFFSAMIVGVSGQSKQFEAEWNVGAGFGPTFSSQSFQSPTVDTKNLTQFHGGLAIRYISEKNIGVIGELNISQQGWEGDFKDNPEYKHSHSLTYLEIPLMTHIYFGNKVRFFINLGPKVQFLLGEKEKFNLELSNTLAQTDPNPNRATQYYRKAEHAVDYGLMGGLGTEFRTAIGSFSLEGRYYFGLGDIYYNKRDLQNFSRSANRVISAKLTYYVKLF